MQVLAAENRREGQVGGVGCFQQQSKLKKPEERDQKMKPELAVEEEEMLLELI